MQFRSAALNFTLVPKATTTIDNIEIYRNPCGNLHKLSKLVSFMTDTERRCCKKNLKLFPIFHFSNLILSLNDRLVFNSMIEGRGGIKICQVERESAGYKYRKCKGIGKRREMNGVGKLYQVQPSIGL